MKLFSVKVTVLYETQFELKMRVPLPFIDWRVRSILLFKFNTGRRRIEWEVWRWISTPGTDESMAALSQTRAAMLWSVKQKYDPSKSLRFNKLSRTKVINDDWVHNSDFHNKNTSFYSRREKTDCHWTCLPQNCLKNLFVVGSQWITILRIIWTFCAILEEVHYL